MKARILALILTLPVSLPLVFAAQPRSNTRQAALSSSALMSLTEVRPGQIGKVRTVFQGTAVEEFECEVIGILKDSIGPHKDMIMIRLRGQKPEFTGVVAGMSGSPVYIEGKLVGALAYRWGAFAKEPIAGVTPIHDIIEIAGFGDAGTRRRAGVPASILGPRFDSADELGEWLAAGFWTGNGQPAAVTAQTTAPGAMMMTPIATPLVFSGFDRRLIDRFQGHFRQHNFEPVVGGGGARDIRQATKFEPGAAIACVLMKGDMSIAGTGTITHVDGDNVFAFGHPMFQVGSTDIPMAKANVVLTLSSSLASFKIAEPTEVVGSIKQDRLTAIMGRMGVHSRMIPVRIEVQTARGPRQSYKFEMFEEPFITPILLNMAVSNAMIGSTDYEAIQTIALNGRIEVEGHPDVVLADVMSSDETDLVFPLAFRASGFMARLFNGLYNNGIKRPTIKGLTLNISQTPERRGAMIEEVRADREEVKPGEEFSVAVILKPFRGERISRLVKLRAPETAERGQELRVMVTDAPGFEAAEGRGRFALSQPATLDELITLLNKTSPSNGIYFRLTQSTPGAIVNQHVLPSLPLSVLTVIGSRQTAANTITAADSALLTAAEPVDFPVSGRRTIRLSVK
jgi:hypothetical protein